MLKIRFIVALFTILYSTICMLPIVATEPYIIGGNLIHTTDNNQFEEVMYAKNKLGIHEEKWQVPFLQKLLLTGCAVNGFSKTLVGCYLNESVVNSVKAGTLDYLREAAEEYVRVVTKEGVQANFYSRRRSFNDAVEVLIKSISAFNLDKTKFAAIEAWNSLNDDDKTTALKSARAHIIKMLKQPFEQENVQPLQDLHNFLVSMNKCQDVFAQEPDAQKKEALFESCIKNSDQQLELSVFLQKRILFIYAGTSFANKKSVVDCFASMFLVKDDMIQQEKAKRFYVFLCSEHFLKNNIIQAKNGVSYFSLLSPGFGLDQNQSVKN